jgi:hypothetical protein
MKDSILNNHPVMLIKLTMRTTMPQKRGIMRRKVDDDEDGDEIEGEIFS